MGCCLMALAGALWPRLILIFLAIFTSMVETVFAGGRLIWPVLGFFFLPTTTLAYVLIKANGKAIDSPWMTLFLIAFMYDLGQLGIFRRVQQQRVHPPAASPGRGASDQGGSAGGRDKFVDL